MSNLLPIGNYTARAVGEVQYGITKSGGDFVRLSLSVQTSEGPRVMTRDLHFTDKTAERSIESLRHCGWTGNDLNLLAVGVDGLGEVDASVTVEHEEYTPEGETEPRTVAKIAWINAAGGAKVLAPMGEGQRKAFAQRFKALAMQVKPTGGAVTAKPATPAQRPANGRPPARPAPSNDMPPVDWEPGMDG